MGALGAKWGRGVECQCLRGKNEELELTSVLELNSDSIISHNGQVKDEFKCSFDEGQKMTTVLTGERKGRYR